MNRLALGTLLTCLLAAGFPTQANDGAHAAVSVTYDHPEKFSETREEKALAPTRASDDYLDTLRRYIEQRGTKMLGKGERLDVVVTDIDRAGSFEPWLGPDLQDVRVIKDIYPPRIDLHFRLFDADGKVLREGQRTLRDPGFLTGGTGVAGRNDGLRYEKQLIDRWMRKGPDAL